MEEIEQNKFGELKSENKKRKFENIDEEINKKIKITNTSLGLSLLQTYDEDLQDDYLTSEDEAEISKIEDVPVTLEVASLENSVIEEIVCEKDVDNENIVEDNISSYVIEEEANHAVPLNGSQDSCGVFDNVNEVVSEDDNINSGMVNKEKKSEINVEQTLDTFLEDVLNNVEKSFESKGENRTKLAGDIVSNNEHCVKNGKHVQENLNSLSFSSTYVSETESMNSVCNLNETESTALLLEVENKSIECLDYNFSIFGKSENIYEMNSNDTEKTECKPTKKVKLNRSKFVRSTDESSTEMKNASPSSESVFNKTKSVFDKTPDTTDSNISDSVTSDSSNVNICQNFENLNKVVNKNENCEDPVLHSSIDEEDILSNKTHDVDIKSSTTLSESVLITEPDQNLKEIIDETDKVDFKNKETVQSVHYVINKQSENQRECSNSENRYIEEIATTDFIDANTSKYAKNISQHIFNENEILEKENVNIETDIKSSSYECDVSDNYIKKEKEIKEHDIKFVESETRINDEVKQTYTNSQNIESECEDTEGYKFELSQSLIENEKIEFDENASIDNSSSDEEIFKDAMESIENDEEIKTHVIERNNDMNIATEENDETVDLVIKTNNENIDEVVKKSCTCEKLLIEETVRENNEKMNVEENEYDERMEIIIEDNDEETKSIDKEVKEDAKIIFSEDKNIKLPQEIEVENHIKESRSMVVEVMAEETKFFIEEMEEDVTTDNKKNKKINENISKENDNINDEVRCIEKSQKIEKEITVNYNENNEVENISEGNNYRNDEMICVEESQETKEVITAKYKENNEEVKNISNKNGDVNDEIICIQESENMTYIPKNTSVEEKFTMSEVLPTDSEVYKKMEEISFRLSDEPSKLEQALKGKIESFHLSTKKIEPSPPREPDSSNSEMLKPITSSNESSESKENIKLHLSVQGNRVSIKKNKIAPVQSTTEPRVKRQYRKRVKIVSAEGAAKSNEKSYKLRTRGKKTAQNKDSTELKSNEKVREILLDDTKNVKKLCDNTLNSPVTVEINRIQETIRSNVTGKVQPIKLKISKNPSVTIECTSKYSPVTIEKIGGTEKSDVSEKIAGMLEEVRKKDLSVPNYMEQAASAWSGPDLQRVERLLKESNITITPVMSSKDISHQSSNSILKPMLTAAKEKSIQKIVSTSLSTSSASITSVLNDSNEENGSESQQSKSRNLNVILQPLDIGEQLHRWKITKPSSGMNITPIPSSTNGKQVDVKSEIRKKIASAERRKQETSDSDIEIINDTKLKAVKSIPDLLPISFPASESTPQALATPNTENEFEQSMVRNSMSPIFPVLTPPIFPKKRGRPTKAMVAARNAYKQSQEAFENFRQQNLQIGQDGLQTPGENGNLSHFMIPLFDITEPVDKTPETPTKGRRGRKPKSDKLDKSDIGDNSIIESSVMDPAREQEEIKRLEDERIKKEQERERKNELRRQKAKERSDLVKAKRLRQKMKAEERQKRAQEQKRLLQEEKKKLEEEIKNLPSSISENDNRTQNVSFGVDDESSNTTVDLGQRIKKCRMEVTDLDSKDLTVDQIAEYQWPIQGGELYMIQEQISNYLGVKSFKRKYPDIKRRPVDSEERAYLVDSGLVLETLCDLGITAVCSAEVLDIMCSDFPEKYEELRKHMREKQMKELSFKQKAWANGLGYKLLMADGSKQDLKKRAMESASNWNSALNKSRAEDRRCAMDLQTFIIHYPKIKAQKMTVPTPKIGSFPVSILPGQFCDFYKNYTSTELRYFPVNTVLYGPLKYVPTANGVDNNQTDSDDSSSSDDSSTTSEGTQVTEDTIEDIDKDMSLDEQSHCEKLQDGDTSFRDVKDIAKCEMLNSMRETLSEDENLKLLCKVCLGDQSRNKENVTEVLISCSQCSSLSHPTCLDLSLNMVPHIQSYKWQCPDCKSCARCKENADEDKMLFCDICDRGYHIYCVGLKKVPSGSWQCQECALVENNIARTTMSTLQNGMNVSVKIEG